MLSSLVNNAGQYLHTNPWLALIAVFVGGILTASNPCVLAMIPLMMSFVAGRREDKPGVLRASLFSFVFILGVHPHGDIIMQAANRFNFRVTAPEGFMRIAAKCPGDAGFRKIPQHLNRHRTARLAD